MGADTLSAMTNAPPSITEEIATMEFAVKRTVDRMAANGMLRVPGETAERLRACRLDKSKLSVR